jgi:hypothetical protein
VDAQPLWSCSGNRDSRAVADDRGAPRRLCNAAIALYQRLGWQHVGTGIADWTAPDGSHEVLHYFAAPSLAG